MSTQLAIVVGPTKSEYSVKEIAVPTPAEDEILVKIEATAQNPADWAEIEYGFARVDFVLGLDFAGTVIETGSKVTKAQKGDRVAGLTFGNACKPGHGAFSQYNAHDGENFFKIPDNVSFDEAATTGIYATSLYIWHLLDLPQPPAAKNDIPILIWAASTQVGMACVQTAKLSGFTVIATASSKNFDLIKAIGADHVFNYADPEVTSKIKEVTGDGLYLAVDSITANGSTELILKSFGSKVPSGNKKTVAVTLAPPNNLGDLAKDVHIEWVFGYKLFGVATKVYGVELQDDPETRAWSIRAWGILQRLLEDGKIKFSRTRVLGSLENVPEGFALMKDGKISAEIIIYHPPETKIYVVVILEFEVNASSL